jgi:hypothetical protein
MERALPSIGGLYSAVKIASGLDPIDFECAVTRGQDRLITETGSVCARAEWAGAVEFADEGLCLAAACDLRVDVTMALRWAMPSVVTSRRLSTRPKCWPVSSGRHSLLLARQCRRARPRLSTNTTNGT